jgi:hypothetical protein
MSGPPHQYSIAAPTARKFVVGEIKRLLQHYRREADVRIAQLNLVSGEEFPILWMCTIFLGSGGRGEAAKDGWPPGGFVS